MPGPSRRKRLFWDQRGIALILPELPCGESPLRPIHRVALCQQLRIASRENGNIIWDQTNVYPTARRRKLGDFKGPSPV